MEFKLKPEEARKLWVDALRSGQYQQCDAGLRIRNTFCCLGVACDLFEKTEGGLKIEEIESGWFYYDGTGGFLPEKVQGWLGLATEEGAFNDGSGTLSRLNDSGTPFTEIAEVIESNPPGLFTESK